MSWVIVTEPKNPDQGIMLSIELNMTLREAKEKYFEIVKTRENDHWMLVDDYDEIDLDLVDDNKTLSSYGIGCGYVIKAVPSIKDNK